MVDTTEAKQVTSAPSSLLFPEISLDLAPNATYSREDSARLHDPSPHVAVDATYYERSPASKHYCDRTNYCVQTIEATKLIDTDTQAMLNVHCTTPREGSDAEVCAQLARRYPGELQSLAADKG